MAANFPNDPDTNDTFTSNGITFTWNGEAWKHSASPGVKGTKGDKGQTGEKGQKGDGGDKGQKGEIGLSGNPGGDGNKGDKGSKGEPSTVKGQKGDAGADGTDGTSVKGDKGQKGQDGADATGTKGNKGEPGADGSDGTSVKGQKGESGADGTDGTSIKGDKGQKGQDGNDGTGIKGNKGEEGSFGGATFDYTFSSSTGTPTDLNTGRLRLNNSSVSSATIMFIDDEDDNGTDIQAFIRTIDDSTSTIKGHFKISNKSDASDFAIFTISSASEQSGFHQVNCSYVSGSASSFSNGEDILITFARTGNTGDKGQKGEPSTVKGQKGESGADGTDGTSIKGDKGDFQKGQKGDKGVTGATGSQTFTVTNNGSSNYIIDGQNNPTLTLVRGFTYSFNVNVSGHPFWIKTSQTTGTSNGATGVTNNGAQTGTVTFVVPSNAPATLYYICQYHNGMVGTINTIDNGQKGDKGSKGEPSTVKGQKGEPSTVKGQKGEPGADGTDGSDGTSIKGDKGDFQKGQKGDTGSANTTQAATVKVRTDSGNAFHNIVFVDSLTDDQFQIVKMDDENHRLQWNPSSEVLKAYRKQSYQVLDWASGSTGSAGQVLTSQGSSAAWTWTTPSTGGSTTINNNADNRVITGSGTANTLEGESNLTFDGSTLEVSGSGIPTIESGSSLNVTATSVTFNNSASFAGGHPTSRFYSGADDLVVANFTQDTGISIFSGTSNTATIAMGSTTFGTGALRGTLSFDSGNSELVIQTQTTGTDIKLKSAGTIELGDANNPTMIIDDMTASGSNYGVEVDGTIYPKITGAAHPYRDLGLAGVRWTNVYATNLHGDGSNITNITGGVPTGTIVMYNGDVAPSGWALCDGQGGRPDLRDKFIVGAGSAYSRGNTGGSKDAVVVSHSHSVITGQDEDSDTGCFEFVDNASSTYTRSGLVNSEGVSGTDKNLPPYYALTYIIKT